MMLECSADIDLLCQVQKQLRSLDECMEIHMNERTKVLNSLDASLSSLGNSCSVQDALSPRIAPSAEELDYLRQAAGAQPLNQNVPGLFDTCLHVEEELNLIAKDIEQHKEMHKRIAEMSEIPISATRISKQRTRD